MPASTSTERIWSSRDGETALRRMVEAMIRLWTESGHCIVFRAGKANGCRDRRHMAEADGYRRGDLRWITDRLEREGRIAGGTRPGRRIRARQDIQPCMTSWARGVAPRAALATVMDAVVAAVIEPGSRSAIDEPADWSGVTRPPFP
jgi:hypothetical protein